ncbi:MAG: SDR family NAD(P)-dependent oxidoreductase [Deltaproteobacteria bacterium]|nr:SDR family NAD(P)-dependent oxidoreductase [Deltaproteobacteria bacterium]
MKLSGKVAIVTGSRRGMGKAFALGFAQAGADVVICGRSDDDTLQQVAKEVEASGHGVLALKVDVSQEADVENMVNKTMKKFGRIDVLVNNAGVAFHFPFQETPLKRWLLVLNVNLTGAFLCSKYVVPIMIEQKSGSIINISSGSAIDNELGPVPTGIAYGVSKAGLERMTLGMATELGQYNIAVNAIKPVKPVSTEGMQYWMAEADKSNWQTPDKMVKCAILLAQQDASGITGIVCTDDEFTAWHGL